MTDESNIADGELLASRRGRRPSLVSRIAQRYGVDAGKMLDTLKQTAFRLPAKRGEQPKEISNEQMMALLIVADQYELNPFTKEIYAFPDDRGGVVPIVGVDGWSRIINSHPDLDGVEFRWSEEERQVDAHAQQCPAWCEAVIHRKDRAHPVVVREYIEECYRAPFGGKRNDGSTYTVRGPWQSHTKRMLRHKALIQCTRLAFGFVGIYDEDEGRRIVDAQWSDVAEARERPLIEQPRRKSERAAEAEESPEPEPEASGAPAYTAEDLT